MPLRHAALWGPLFHTQGSRWLQRVTCARPSGQAPGEHTRHPGWHHMAHAHRCRPSPVPAPQRPGPLLRCNARSRSSHGRLAYRAQPRRFADVCRVRPASLHNMFVATGPRGLHTVDHGRGAVGAGRRAGMTQTEVIPSLDGAELCVGMRNDAPVTHRLLQTVRRLLGRRARARAGRPTFIVDEPRKEPCEHPR